MRCAANIRLVAAGLTVVSAVATASAQQATVWTPFHSVGDSFFENIGVGWRLHGNGFFAQFGGPTMAAPPFGGFDPGAGANLGFGFQRGDLGGSLIANFSQGSRRSFVSQVPCITVTNGMPGYMAVGTMRPFVISYVPVVGGYPATAAVFLPAPLPVAPSASSGVGADAVRQGLRQAAAQRDGGLADPIAREVPPDLPAPEIVPLPEPAPAHPARAAEPAASRLALARQSTAGRPAPSVEEAKRLRAAEAASREAEARVHYERGLSAEESGNLGAARIYYQMAARHAGGDFRRQVLQRLEAVKKASN